MYRFYASDLPSKGWASDKQPDMPIRLDPDQAHHARRVLRLEQGQSVQLFNGKGTVGQGVIRYDPNGCQVQLLAVNHVPPPRPQVTMAAAMPKGPRAGGMVNQISQLGANRFIPLRTHRGVVRPQPARLDQLRRIAIESAKQSRRDHLMEIDPAARLESVLTVPHDLCLVAHHDGRPRSGPQPPADPTAALATAGHVLILIGPEGGWTDQEIDTAVEAGARVWSLGPHVLRIETAAAAAVAITRYFTQSTAGGGTD